MRALFQQLTVALFCTALAFAQGDPKALATFEKAFAAARKGKDPAPVEVRRAALAGIGQEDSAKVAEALADAFAVVGAEGAVLDAERAKALAEIAEILKGQEAAGNRVLPQDKHARYNQLKEEVSGMRGRGDALRVLQGEVGTRIGQLRRKDALVFLLQKVCGSKSAALPLKLAAARAVGSGAADVMPELAAALLRAKEPEEQIALLDAMALAGKTAQLHASPVVALLSSPTEAVAERAALALARIAVPDAVGPMIDLLARSSGQFRMRVAAALEVLTGQQHGINTGAWKAWWQAEGAAVAAGTVELGKGIPSHRKETDKNYYFGIPQDQSNAILYVLDCSDSMKAKVDFVTGGTSSGGAKDTTRLEACKAELVRALGLLRPEQKFAILWFNDLPHWYEQKMQPATKDNVAKAQTFVKGLSHASSTNIHDSLEQAFTLVGRGARDRYYGVELDTVFLLTDGSPTKPDGSLDSTEEILVSARAWNPLKRVTIHTIAIGRDLNEGFLRQLATENGGEFKRP
ncbi:MAG: hypothetical protein RL148_2086 [Planctomycetota bacterium]|jgi:hypothetical protein